MSFANLFYVQSVFVTLLSHCLDLSIFHSLRCSIVTLCVSTLFVNITRFAFSPFVFYSVFNGTLEEKGYFYGRESSFRTGWGGIKLNQAGKLIQFTLDEPEYMIVDSKAVSKRIRDIKNILEMRYGMEFVSQIYFSQSCLEGKEIFDKVKNDFIE